MTGTAADRAGTSGAVPAHPLTLTDAHLRLLDVERRLDLLQYTVGGWAVWPLLRFEVSLLLSAVALSHGSAPGRGDRLRGALADLPRLARIRPARHFVKTYSSGLQDAIGDRWADVWFDDVMLAAGSTFKLEAANNAAFAARSRRAFIRRDLSSTVLDVGAALLARSPAAADVAPVSRALGRALRDGFGLSAIDDVWVERRLRHFAAAVRVYQALLRRVRPTFVLVADASEHALVAAARESGCTVLELQHGISDGSNAGYSWSNYATPYRQTMPLPDRLLLYGEHWRRELQGGGFWGDSLRVVGSPRIDRYRGQTPVRSGEVCTMLFTTQGLDVAPVSAFLGAFLQILNRRVPLRLVVKLHPIHDADKRPYLAALSSFADQVEIQAGDEGLSTFEWLRRAHLHASVASASHYDAVGLGVPTVILPFRTHEIVLPVYHAGHAYLARTPGDLADLALSWRDLRLGDDVSEYYFKSGARASILGELGLRGLDDVPAIGAGEAYREEGHWRS